MQRGRRCALRGREARALWQRCTLGCFISYAIRGSCLFSGTTVHVTFYVSVQLSKLYCAVTFIWIIMLKIPTRQTKSHNPMVGCSNTVDSKPAHGGRAVFVHHQEFLGQDITLQPEQGVKLRGARGSLT